MIQENIQTLIEGVNLSPQNSRLAMQEIMSGQATNAQIGAFLTALRMKGETVEELVAFAEVMRENCLRIHPNVQGRLVDTCGTGGDKLKTFNVSTATAFVVAGTGLSVAKHGNSSVTSKSGSADVLERLGVNLTISPEAVRESIEHVGIGFMFAPAFHPAMKYAVAPRKEMGVRTVFNVLGPLTNPACANAQVLGVYDTALTEPLACALKKLGCAEAMVVYGVDGLDEISTIGKTTISHLKDSNAETFNVSPEDFGVKHARIQDLLAATPEENANVLFEILHENTQKANPKTDIVLVNSAAAIVVGGRADSLKEGMDVARESIRSGAAYKKLEALVKSSGGDLSKLEEIKSRHV